MVAAREGHVEIIRLLATKYGAELNAVDSVSQVYTTRLIILTVLSHISNVWYRPDAQL